MILSCAKDLPPAGGPPDTTPPQLLASSPASGDIEVPTQTAIELQFSERVNAKTVGNALFISPPLRTEPRVQVKGARVVITPSEPLDSGRTYVLTLGASLQDLQGNRLPASISIAFSTGVAIDSATISGRVFQNLRPLPNFRVFAYEWSEQLPDSIFERRPSYITETGAEGDFRFHFLRPGEYLVVAVEDRDRDNRINWGRETFALANTLVHSQHPDSVLQPIELHTTQHDSTQLALINCAGVAGEIVLRFSGGRIDRGEVKREMFQIITQENDTLIPQSVAAFTSEPDKVYLYDDRLQVDVSYRVFIRNLVSSEGKRLADDTTSCTVRLRGADTKPPAVTERRPPESQRLILPTDTIVLVFSEPIQIADSSALIIVDSITAIYATPELLDQTSYAFYPDATLPANQRLKFELLLHRIADRAGTVPVDTVYRFEFTRADPDSLGRIVGRLDVLPDDNVAVELTGVVHRARYLFRGVEPGTFTWQVYPDLYQVRAFSDRNDNGRWDLGSLKPLTFAERGWIMSDSLRVRARFDLEDVELIFR